MICQATYDSLEAIPETLRDEFQQVSGKWQLKDTAIPGVGPLFNQALAANEAKAVGQVKTRNDKIRLLEEQLGVANDKLAVLDTPGNTVLSKDDTGLWDQYTKLGTPKEIADKLKELPALKQAVEKQQVSDGLSKVASAALASGVKINPEVLADWAVSPEAEGISFLVKTVEQTDTKGGKVNVEVPYVRIEKTTDGKTEVMEKELLPFAKEVMPEWKYAALTTEVAGSKAANGNGSLTSAKPAMVGGGVKIPDLSSAKNTPEGGGNKERPVDVFNKQRDARPNPFAKPAMPVAGAIQAVKDR